MARSTYVYTVHHDLTTGSVLVGAFTVKHEMVTAVQRWIDACGGQPDMLRILRNADGAIHLPDDITKQFVWSAPR